jgi:choline dehydrogenase
MFYVRGDSRDYDHWANDLGHKGWSYRDVLPYFLRSERQIGRFNQHRDVHNTDGELFVRDSIFLSPLVAGYEKMAKIHGYNQTDANDGNLEGFEIPQLTIDAQGRRSDTYSAFLKDIESKRKNLVIVRNANVAKVLFTDDTTVATGTINCHYQIFPSEAK